MYERVMCERISARRYACMHNSRLSLWPSEHARGVLSRAIASGGGQSAVLDFAKITSALSSPLSTSLYVAPMKI